MDSEKAIASALTEEKVAESLELIAATYVRPTYAGVACVDGFGVKVAVKRGALLVSDGIGPHRRERVYGRATHGIRRLVVHNADGYVSLEALRWCQALAIAVVVLGPDGAALFASTPRMTNDARLRRQQALAVSQPVGLGIAKYLLGEKLRRQESAYLVDLDAATDLDECRDAEARAAYDYWGTWEAKPRFRGDVPKHWTRWSGRISIVTRYNRGADRPVNAVLNYLYALAEAEAVIACHAVGLDPGLGILHRDQRGKVGMAYDLMEPVRPEVDEYARKLFEGRMWRARDFHELPNGVCRVLAPLTHELAETLPLWAAKVAPHAERVAHLLGEAMKGRYVASTPLTKDVWRVKRPQVRRRRDEEELARYWAEVFPVVKELSLAEIAALAGCSQAYASRIRRGLRAPKTSTWPVLGNKKDGSTSTVVGSRRGSTSAIGPSRP